MITGINFYGYHLQIVSIMATLQRKKNMRSPSPYPDKQVNANNISSYECGTASYKFIGIDIRSAPTAQTSG